MDRLSVARWVPGIALAFYLVVAWGMFAAENAFIADPGVARHLYTGAWILSHGEIPFADPLSWRTPPIPWIDFEWGFEVLIASLVRLGGIPLAYACAWALYALIPCLLWRMLARRGFLWPASVIYVAACILFFRLHLLMRPLLFTYVFMALVVLWYWNHRRGPGKAGWVLLLAVFAVWCNLHGGFTAALVFLAAAVLGRGLDCLVRRRRAFLADAGLKSWSLFGLAAGAATLLNPHGIGLHGLVIEMVFHIKSFRYWDEFLPPDFVAWSPAAVAIAFVAGSLAAMLVLTRRWRWEEMLPVLVFLYFSVNVQRHVLLLLIVAAIPAARGWHALIVALMSSETVGRWRQFSRVEQRSVSHRWQIPLAAAFMIAAFAGLGLGNGLRVGNLSLTPEAVDFLRANADRFRRPLTSTWVAGPLLYYLGPEIRVSHDDRTDLYRDAIIEPYIRILNAQPGWEQLIAKDGYDSAILDKKRANPENPGATMSRLPDFPINRRLGELPGWKRVYEDDYAIVYIYVGS